MGNDNGRMLSRSSSTSSSCQNIDDQSMASDYQNNKSNIIFKSNKYEKEVANSSRNSSVKLNNNNKMGGFK